MNNAQWRLRIFQIIGLVLALGSSLNASAGLFGFGGTSWKEEALLHDGSKIIVERSVERGGRHPIGQEPAFKEQSLSFTMPGTNQTIQWEDHYSEDIGSSSFLPMLLDIEDGIVYLVADTMGCLSYNKWGRPNPPYVIFKYQNNAWTRIPLQELPADIKSPNLVISTPDDVAKSSNGFLTADMIRQANAGFRQPEYHTILRTPVSGPDSDTSCMNLVYYKGAWVGPGKNSIGRMMRDGQCSSIDANMRVGCTPNTEHQDK
jgi:hypothetical protein